ncbi:NADH-quinone oxidoreductase subunit C [Sphingobium subterraneum]|uniref:NADH-quinone oxidoreductase subunit C n=1 Tax=Sphingobium subterraneum TaxID=627688 RepID=A0A841J1Z0_9SPHN|nr:NADH-quinone oxidoreductase subunit C [Sphingobium subterraneum]MBB6122665.1 NADH-quinone oxidoreductase subunit C [Sphingobium subterraneum]
MAHSAPRIATIDGIAEDLSALIGADLIDLKDAADELTFVVRRDSIVSVMTRLRDEAQYQQLMEIAGVDYLDRPERFEVVYHLLSVTRNHRIRIKLSTDEDMPVPSVTGIWPVAGWLEREVFDMYGVIFSGNTDLRRILTDYGFRGHPQRKDFPLTGHVELRYSEEEKRVVYEPVQLAQDFRSFDFLSPWEGAQYVLPGDEKAPQAPGAPSPVPAAPPPPPPSPTAPVTTPKVTEKPEHTGAGEAANTASKKRSPAVRKGSASAGGAKSAAGTSRDAVPSASDKPKRTRKPKTEDKA